MIELKQVTSPAETPYLIFPTLYFQNFVVARYFGAVHNGHAVIFEKNAVKSGNTIAGSHPKKPGLVIRKCVYFRGRQPLRRSIGRKFEWRDGLSARYDSMKQQPKLQTDRAKGVCFRAAFHLWGMYF
ncbi:MAG TPA: hypothetical protein PLO67_10715 [Saprospiraceae bacterium]|nr:hypothetical protein [Saprospiraceae bacterium]HPI07095.1 hypothetical protein [Saprospiraceae bacterium]